MGDFGSVLVIDSAMNGCVVAHYDAGAGVCHVDVFETVRGQAERLVPMVQAVVESGGQGFEGLDAIVVTLGPGTFTGIRIGLSTAKALAMALDIPLYGITTLQALALGYVRDHPEDVMVLVETKREDFYAQSFDGQGVARDEARSLLGGEITADCVVIGDAAARFAQGFEGSVRLDESYHVVNPCIIAENFCDPVKKEQFFTKDIEPLYLRAPDVSYPKTPPREL